MLEQELRGRRLLLLEQLPVLPGVQHQRQPGNLLGDPAGLDAGASHGLRGSRAIELRNERQVRRER